MTTPTAARHRHSTHRPQGTVIADRDANTSDFDLTEARENIRSLRMTADVFHTYNTTDREGQTVHVAYGHYKRGTCSGLIPHATTWIWEVSPEAVLDSFGLTPIQQNGAGRPATGPEFAADHGSADTWTTADIESQQHLAEIDQLPQSMAPTQHAATRNSTLQIGIYHGCHHHTVHTSRDNHPDQPYTLRCTCGQTSRHTDPYDLDISATSHAYPTRWKRWATRFQAAVAWLRQHLGQDSSALPARP